jgi:hypothetical protein
MGSPGCGRVGVRSPTVFQQQRGQRRAADAATDVLQQFAPRDGLAKLIPRMHGRPNLS